MATVYHTPHATPPVAPPAGYRWLRRGEQIRPSDLRSSLDLQLVLRGKETPVERLREWLSSTQPERVRPAPGTAPRFRIHRRVGEQLTDLGDGCLGCPNSIRIMNPFLRKAPLTRLAGLEANNRRPPVLGLTYGAWFWHEIPFAARVESDEVLTDRARTFPCWVFFPAHCAAYPHGLTEWVTHFVEAGDSEFPPAPLTEKERLPELVARDLAIRKYLSLAAPVGISPSSAQYQDGGFIFGFSPAASGFAVPGTSLHDICLAELEKRNRVTEKVKVTFQAEPHVFGTAKLVKPTKPKPQTSADIPAGWRKLVDGETVLDTDLYFSPELKRWLPRLGTKRVGKPLRAWSTATIRKVEPAATPKPTITVAEFSKAAEKVLDVRGALLGKPAPCPYKAAEDIAQELARPTNQPASSTTYPIPNTGVIPILYRRCPDENVVQTLRPTSPGDGYVAVGRGERIEAGDEYWNICVTPPRWTKTTFGPGALVGRAFYRRKKPADSPLNPGPGYRLLYDFETPVPGDDYINASSSNPTWQECGHTTDLTIAQRRNNIAGSYDGKSGPEFFAYRRKLVEGQYPGDGYRLLAPHETLQPGDQYRRSTYSPGGWNTTPEKLRETAGGFAAYIRTAGRDGEDDPIIVIRRKLEGNK